MICVTEGTQLCFLHWNGEQGRPMSSFGTAMLNAFVHGGGTDRSGLVLSFWTPRLEGGVSSST